MTPRSRLHTGQGLSLNSRSACQEPAPIRQGREEHLLRRQESATTAEDRAQLRSTSARRGTIVDALPTSMLWPRQDAKPSKGTFNVDSVEQSTAQECDEDRLLRHRRSRAEQEEETAEHETDIVAPPLNSPTPRVGLEELTVLLRHLVQQEAPKSAAAGRACADALPVLRPSRSLERVEVERDANVRWGHVLSAASQS